VPIGLLSDTHMPERLGDWPKGTLEALAGSDLILHAGDVGELDVLERLRQVAPVIAVHGNDDTEAAFATLPETQLVEMGGHRILLWHSHDPDRERELALRRTDEWAPKLERIAGVAHDRGATVVMFGHLHVPLSVDCMGVLLVNPGALAPPNAWSRQVVQTVAHLQFGPDRSVRVTHGVVGARQGVVELAPHWSTGFGREYARNVETILEPRLAGIWGELLALLRPLGPEPYYSVLLRVAHEVWSGHSGVITATRLVGELADDPAVGRDVLDAVRRIVSPRG
jgi:putative phosphoesterase